METSSSKEEKGSSIQAEGDGDKPSSCTKLSKEGYGRCKHEGGHNLFSADSWAASKVFVFELGDSGFKDLVLYALTKRQIFNMEVL